ncbi:nucleotide-binding protein [Diplocloster modestus]|uniref:nitrogenase n=1 Tax=Diplocloster modestus TaxID=2850322 RepID=A0ABS6KDI6_9FIRM|nr:AAA family ATPase [Diplocloster modestus]
MRKIAIYGKGGIGKSTTTSNIACAMTKQGLRVMQIGCDPKSDSTISHTGGQRIPTVLDSIRDRGDSLKLTDIVITGSDGVLCVESGGPTPGVGCAGRGIIAAFEKLDELHAFETFRPDVVLYDVLGDVVCGGFTMPIRSGYAKEVFVVTSGEMMSLYAASNIAAALHNFQNKGYARFGGLIANAKGFPGEEENIQRAAEELNTRVLCTLPRDPLVQQAEQQNRTVVSAFPDSELSGLYLNLAQILERDPL